MFTLNNPPKAPPTAVEIPYALLEKITNYVGTLPWKTVNYICPSIRYVLSAQIGKDSINIDKALLDGVLALLVEQPYDKVNDVMTSVNMWIKYATNKEHQTNSKTITEPTV